MSASDLSVVGTVAALAFVVIFTVDGATRPGYQARYHPVSALALGARGWVQTASFVVCGSAIAVSAVGIHQAGASAPLAGTVAVFGLSLVASGIFPMDPMRGYPPGTPTGTPAVTSMRHRFHDWAGVAVFTSLPAAAAIAAVTLDHTGWRLYAALTAAIGTITFLAFGAAWGRDHPLTGLVQRVAIVVGWSWLSATCWHLASLT